MKISGARGVASVRSRKSFYFPQTRAQSPARQSLYKSVACEWRDELSPASGGPSRSEAVVFAGLVPRIVIVGHLTRSLHSIRQSEARSKGGVCHPKSNKTPICVGCHTVTRVPVLTWLASGGKSEAPASRRPAGQRPPAVRKRPPKVSLDQRRWVPIYRRILATNSAGIFSSGRSFLARFRVPIDLTVLVACGLMSILLCSLLAAAEG